MSERRKYSRKGYAQVSKSTKYRRINEILKAESFEQESSSDEEEVASLNLSSLASQEGETCGTCDIINSGSVDLEKSVAASPPTSPSLIESDSFGDDSDGARGDSPGLHSVYESSDSDASFANGDSDGEEFSDLNSDGEDLFEENSDMPKYSLLVNLRIWGVTYKITKVALSALLRILKSSDPNELHTLPLDGRTIMRTPRHVIVKKLEKAGGEFYYFGLMKAVQNALERTSEKVTNIAMVTGINGLPLFKSSGVHFTPILGKIISIPDLRHHVFPIAIHCGDTDKPQDAEEFLSPFIDEVTDLIKNGVNFKGNVYNFTLKGFSCDCPAKSFVLSSIASNGKYGCTKCVQEGKWSHLCRRTFFPQVDARLKTHEDFINKTVPQFHLGDSPLLRIPGIDFINDFPLDYLHLVCVGVVKTLVKLWVFASKNNAKLPAERICQASGKMLLYEKFIPSEFARRSRAMEDVKRWKATELRLFGCYLGPYVLDGILSEQRLGNFVLLYVSLRLLLNPVRCREYKEIATEMLVEFVENCKTAYADNLLTHNFHNLVHLPRNLDSFDNMEDCSTFDFESFLQYLKQTVVKGDKPLQQCVKRIEEADACPPLLPSKKPDFPRCSMPYRCRGPFLEGCARPTYQTVHFPTFKLSVFARDSCFTTLDGSIFVLRNICTASESNDILLVGRKFLQKENAFNTPCPSSDLKIYIVSNLSEMIVVPVCDVQYKNMLLPFRSKFVAQPILHTLL
ncbi:uncharacterized protein [Bemisia tabaci]|uniref:uncharacterized protein isoform X1 n=1 Tax=Bemisia tabaci TaxID=7038 RepID=UPI003B2898C1